MRYRCFLFLLLIGFLTSCSKNTDISPCNCELPVLSGENSAWEEFIGSDTTLAFYPDAYTNYWRYGFDRSVNDSVGIRISGTFGSARYMSLSVYDDYWRTPIANMIDYSIEPLCCNNNPFRPNANLENDQRNFIIEVVPEGLGYVSAYNVLEYPGNFDEVSIFLRYLLPEGNEMAGVELPKLEAFNVYREVPMSLPANTPIGLIPHEIVSEVVLPSYSMLPDSIVRFFNYDVDKVYPNLDEQFLGAPLQRWNDEVLMVRFKAPNYAQNNTENLSADVRYWSISQSNEFSFNKTTLADFEAVVAEDGFVNIVIGNDTPEIRAKAQGLNFMPWRTQTKMFLVYRNLGTRGDYENAIVNVPLFNNDNTLESQAGHLFIGDYAPIGVLLPLDDYLQDFGGFPVSY